MIAINMEMPKSCAKCKLCEYNEHIGYYCVANNGGKFTMTREEMKENRLDDCPLAEIITCKDCKNWNFNENHSILCVYCSNLETETGEDFYCANAESEERLCK